MLYTIYLISAEIDQNIYYKIGYTKRDVYKRLNELKTANASDLTVIKTYKSTFGSKLESFLHRYFKNKKINREWFLLSSDDINNFENICESYCNQLEVILNENTWAQESKLFSRYISI